MKHIENSVSNIEMLDEYIVITSDNPIKFNSTCSRCNYSNISFATVEVKDARTSRSIIERLSFFFHFVHIALMFDKLKPVEIPICEKCYRETYFYGAYLVLSMLFSVIIIIVACFYEDALILVPFALFIMIAGPVLYVHFMNKFIGISVQQKNGRFIYVFDKKYRAFLQNGDFVN